jgi:hypothetical protein
MLSELKLSQLLVRKLIGVQSIGDCLWVHCQGLVGWLIQLSALFICNTSVRKLQILYATIIRIPTGVFIHFVICLTTGPKPLPKWVLHIVLPRFSSFRLEYPLLSLSSSSSFLRHLLRLPVTFIPPFIFPSVTCCRSQFLRKMCPIKLVFRLLISCRIFFFSLTLSNTSSVLTWSVQLIFSIHPQHHISKLSWRTSLY